jgi:hypothetical protein
MRNIVPLVTAESGTVEKGHFVDNARDRSSVPGLAEVTGCVVVGVALYRLGLRRCRGGVQVLAPVVEMASSLDLRVALRA